MSVWLPGSLRGGLSLSAALLPVRWAGFSLVVASRPLDVAASPVAEHRLLARWTSVVAARGLGSCGSRALGHRLNSWAARIYLLRGMWDLPRPGIEPVSPALAGGFFTTEPSEKPRNPHSYCPVRERELKVGLKSSNQ